VGILLAFTTHFDAPSYIWTCNGVDTFGFESLWGYLREAVPSTHRLHGGGVRVGILLAFTTHFDAPSYIWTCNGVDTFGFESLWGHHADRVNFFPR